MTTLALIEFDASKQTSCKKGEPMFVGKLTLATVNNLAILYADRGRLDEAESFSATG